MVLTFVFVKYMLAGAKECRRFYQMLVMSLMLLPMINLIASIMFLVKPMTQIARYCYLVFNNLREVISLLLYFKLGFNMMSVSIQLDVQYQSVVEVLAKLRNVRLTANAILLAFLICSVLLPVVRVVEYVIGMT